MKLKINTVFLILFICSCSNIKFKREVANTEMDSIFSTQDLFGDKYSNIVSEHAAEISRKFEIYEFLYSKLEAGPIMGDWIQDVIYSSYFAFLDDEKYYSLFGSKDEAPRDFIVNNLIVINKAWFENVGRSENGKLKQQIILSKYLMYKLAFKTTNLQNAMKNLYDFSLGNLSKEKFIESIAHTGLICRAMYYDPIQLESSMQHEGGAFVFKQKLVFAFPVQLFKKIFKNNIEFYTNNERCSQVSENYFNCGTSLSQQIPFMMDTTLKFNETSNEAISELRRSNTITYFFQRVKFDKYDLYNTLFEIELRIAPPNFFQLQFHRIYLKDHMKKIYRVLMKQGIRARTSHLF